MSIWKYSDPLWAMSCMLAMRFARAADGADCCPSRRVTIAAASDLNFAIKEVIEEYEKQSGHKVKLSLGSSGNFFAQLQQGAPFDLYFSADIGYPRKLGRRA